MEEKTAKVEIKFPWNSERWKRVIVPLLDKHISNSSEFEKVIEGIAELDPGKARFLTSYLKDAKRPISSEAFFGDILPYIQSLVLGSPKTFSKSENDLKISHDTWIKILGDQIPIHIVEDRLPVLMPQTAATVILDRKKIACLLANAFFCIFDEESPRHYIPRTEFPDLSFTLIHGAFYSTTFAAKMDCVLNYFNRIRLEPPIGSLIITRRCRQPQIQWKESIKPLRSVKIDTTTIESCDQAISHADFANEYLGGGVLHGGNVQEEILFVIKPECLVPMLFCAKMEDNEAISIIGAEQFSKYAGYGSLFRFNGDFKESPSLHRFPDGTISREIFAIDALIISNKLRQFEWKSVNRELRKAFVGFLQRYDVGSNEFPESFKAIATGNWGSGAFGGDKHLKFLIQLLAASEADRDVYYFTFKDIKLMEQAEEFLKVLRDNNIKTVGELVTLYLETYENLFNSDSQNVLEYLSKCLIKSRI